jgi:uncharacterized membrane protein HdeD (DUF308 family)
MAVQSVQRAEPAVIVEEELRRINAPQLKQELRNLSGGIIALGVIEAIFGIMAIVLPYLTATFFVVLLGAVIAGAGFLQIVNAIVHRTATRFILGAVGVIGGGLVMANPLFGLSFLTTLIGLYLVGSGILRLFSRPRPGGELIAGIGGIVLGLLVWFGMNSAVAVAWLVGLYLIASGFGTGQMGARLMAAVNRTNIVR